jgi:hypothetical protein
MTAHSTREGKRMLFGGNPIYYSHRDGVHINSTLPTHMFHDGRVVTAVFVYEGSVYMYTKGVGIGADRDFNAFIGPLLFNSMQTDVWREFNIKPPIVQYHP